MQEQWRLWSGIVHVHVVADGYEEFGKSGQAHDKILQPIALLIN